MTMGVFDFKAIKRKLDCQEQKAEFEEKNPPVDLGMYGYPSNLTPMIDGGSCESVTLTISDMPANLSDWPVLTPITPSEWNEAARKYMADYAGTFNIPDFRGRVKADRNTALTATARQSEIPGCSDACKPKPLR